MKERGTYRKQHRTKSNPKPSLEQSISRDDSERTPSLPTTIHAEHEQPKEEPKPDQHRSKNSTENENTTRHEAVQIKITSPDDSFDEGWQEASTRGRSGYSRRKIVSKVPPLKKLIINYPDASNSGIAGYKKRAMSPRLNVNSTTPRSPPTDFPSGLGLKDANPNGGEDSRKKPQFNPPDNDGRSEEGLKASITSRVTTVASKFVTYKEVAVSPPGTVFKPEEPKKEMEDTKDCTTLETSDELSPEEALNEVHSDESDKEALSSEVETPIVDESSSCSDENTGLTNTSKKSETNGSKLSASAPPFNPGYLLPMAHSYNSVAGVYDMRAPHQVVPPQHLGIPSHQSIDARVPRGPRSNSYYRTSLSFRRKHTHRTSMNPHAAEFVPGKAWQQVEKQESAPETASKEETIDTVNREKGEEVPRTVDEGKGKDGKARNIQSLQKAELARQILLSFIVKSVQDTLSSSNENEPTKKTERESRDEGKPGSISLPGVRVPLKTVDVYKAKNKDTEGFTLVSKRRSKQQFAKAQPSICTSVG